MLRLLASRIARRGRSVRVEDPSGHAADPGLAACRGLDDLRHHICSEITARLGPDRIVIFEPADGGTMYRATWSSDRTRALPSLTAPGRGRLARWLRVNGESLRLDPQSDLYSWWASGERDLLRETAATLCLPFVVSGRLAAIAFIAGASAGPRNAPNIPDLEAFARHAAARWNELDTAGRADRAARALYRSQQLSVAGQLAATVSHEVRNPLAAIRSLVQFVRDADPEASERKRLLTGVVEEVDRVEQTVARHLDLTRAHTPPSLEIDAGDLAGEVVSFVQPYAKRRRVNLDFHGSDVPLRVRADPAELRQVLINVLLNACQACTGAGRVEVSAEPRRTDGRPGAEITVTDDGQGMGPADVARVFEPFFTTKPDGTGLGLSFCRDALARCGGSIDLTSASGRGTRVVIHIPLTPPIHGLDSGHRR
ncbi:MAG TPA: HAMP domain-containing sensor histidine kinase [Vicinamibacterales bacterium]|nr:HAMP domain-containing sensor histidine kinase [Vicinamibacterales bacterium]